MIIIFAIIVYLNNHFLSSKGRVGEGQLVALAARIWSAECGKTVSQIVVDSEWLVAVADIRRTVAYINKINLFKSILKIGLIQ